MAFLRKFILGILLLASIAFAGFLYLNKKGPCEVPITYTLGTFDTRFNISKANFMSDVESATHVWENSIGKNLFEYAPVKNEPLIGIFKYFIRQPITINLIYDSRQKTSDAQRVVISAIDETKSTASEIKQQFLALENRYKIAQTEYLSLLSEYKNRRGDRNTLEAKRLEVNGLADDVNALVKKYNYLVNSVNTTINKINQTASQEFEEGEYVSDSKGERINIYEFGNGDILTRVLTHEFGHALGLDHNSNPNSIMYYLNTSKNIVPTKEDVGELRVICKGQ